MAFGTIWTIWERLSGAFEDPFGDFQETKSPAIAGDDDIVDLPVSIHSTKDELGKDNYSPIQSVRSFRQSLEKLVGMEYDKELDYARETSALLGESTLTTSEVPSEAPSIDIKSQDDGLIPYSESDTLKIPVSRDDDGLQLAIDANGHLPLESHSDTQSSTGGYLPTRYELSAVQYPTQRKPVSFRSLISKINSKIWRGTPPLTPKDLVFCFNAVGTELLLWTKNGSEYIVRIILPLENNQCAAGYKLEFRPPAAQDRLTKPHTVVRLVAGGTKSVAAVIFEENDAKLIWFDNAGSRTQLFLHYTQPSLALAVSRDDTKVVLGCGAVIHLYHIVDGNLRLKESATVGSGTSNVSLSHRRLQKVNFSSDSKKVMTATQICNASNSHLVLVGIRDCSAAQMGPELRLNSTMLNLGYADDTGISGIFCAEDVSVQKLFLAAMVTTPYTAILGHTAHKHIDVAQISSAAQGSTQSHNGAFVFQSGRHKLYLLDVLSEHLQEIADFSGVSARRRNRSGVMVVGMPCKRQVLSFWRTSNGILVFARINLSNGARPAVYIKELQEVYLGVS